MESAQVTWFVAYHDGSARHERPFRTRDEATAFCDDSRAAGLRVIGMWSDRIAREQALPNWTPEYDRWRHGGWYVTNLQHPAGGCGCVSRNYPDKKWRIVCDPRPNAHEAHTYRSRDDAARAERDLILDRLKCRSCQAATLPGDRYCPMCGSKTNHDA